MSNALELRVLEGRQRGARTTLEAGRPCLVAASSDGHADDADVVLREDGIAPVKIKVTARLPNALVEVLAGEVTIGEQVLGAGAQAPWAVCTPLRIGGTVIAFGRPTDVDWSSDAHSVPAPEAPAATRKKRRGAEVWLVAIGGVIAVVCLGAQLYGRKPAAEAPAAVQESEATRFANALKASDFGALEVIPDPLGRISLRGRLATHAERQALDAWLAANRFSPTVQVQVDEYLLRDVIQTFQLNDVSAHAKLTGPGRIHVSVAERDKERVERAADAVRRDLKEVSLTVENTATPAPPPAPPVIDDPNKRIASVVPGNPAYLVTVDGARYFVGATLPTGHRIVRIAGTGVTVERDGQPQTLNF